MINIFLEWIKELNITLNDQQLDQLDQYKNILIEENKKYNLTSITNEEDIYLKHFYDSLTLVKAIDFNKINSVMDIGSGAGFPGIVLKIVFPHLNITLIDSNHKKTDFLKLLINKLNLSDCEVLHTRCEELPKNYRDHFDLVTARAVSELRIITELAIPFVKKDGYFVAMKSNCEDEIKSSKAILAELHSKIEELLSFELPNGNLRNLVKIRKQEITNLKYPRRYNEIIKKH